MAWNSKYFHYNGHFEFSTYTVNEPFQSPQLQEPSADSLCIDHKRPTAPYGQHQSYAQALKAPPLFSSPYT